MVTKAVSDFFGKGGIADQMIRFNGFPFLDKEDHQFNEPVSHVIKRNVLAIPAVGMKLDELGSFLLRHLVKQARKWLTIDSDLSTRIAIRLYALSRISSRAKSAGLHTSRLHHTARSALGYRESPKTVSKFSPRRSLLFY